MSKKIPDPERQLAYLAYVNRENNFQHHGYVEEMKQYRLMQAGDMTAVEESQRMMRQNPVVLSKDPVRNVKYLFLANITITTRFAIEGGLDAEIAYNASDMYIRQMDECKSIEEVMDLHREYFTWFTQKMAGLKKETVYSRPVVQCMDYIDAHLHTPLRTTDLAKAVFLSPAYLSTLFKKETGFVLSDYIMNRKIDTASNMLRYSEYSASQISEILAFSSQSYFIRCFKARTGMTPFEYQKKHLGVGLDVAKRSPATDVSQPISWDA